MTPIEIVSDEEISKAFLGTSFGDSLPRNLVNEGVLKRVCWYHNGYTLDLILGKLGLVTPKKKRLTKKGREYLWAICYEPNFGRNPLRASSPSVAEKVGVK